MNAFTAMPVFETVLGEPLMVEPPPPASLEEPASDSFGPLEWLVIAIGQRDGPSSFRSTPLLEAIARLFAWRQPNQLANTRLEELRRMAAHASERGWHVPPSEMASFLRAGWSEDQLELLIENVSPVVHDERGSERSTRGSITTLPSYFSLAPTAASRADTGISKLIK